MGTKNDFSIVLLVISYPTGEGKSSSVSVPMPVLYQLVKGEKCTTTLTNNERRAMLHQNYLVPGEDGTLLPGPRLLWQTGHSLSSS